MGGIHAFAQVCGQKRCAAVTCWAPPESERLLAMGVTRASRDGPAERSRTRAAVAFADERHAGQRRDGDGAPFVLHPVEVAWLLHDEDYPDHVVAAGVLHDVLENTETDRAELEARFGPEVAELVAALSEDPAIADEVDRKSALRQQVAEAGPEAAAVFAADKISKARELRAHAAQAQLDTADMVKLDHYERSYAMLEQLLPSHPLVAGLRVELEALRAATDRGPSNG
jgi:(p)ppGpp synthase/HD superfamily hydrolase